MMPITTRSIRAYRRLSGVIAAELRVEVQGETPTAWQIQGLHTKSPYAIVDGHRYDLQTHEVLALRKAISEVG
jgi:hypothetical protein